MESEPLDFLTSYSIWQRNCHHKFRGSVYMLPQKVRLLCLIVYILSLTPDLFI